MVDSDYSRLMNDLEQDMPHVMEKTERCIIRTWARPAFELLEQSWQDL